MCMKGEAGRVRRPSERGNSGQCLVFYRCTNEPQDTQTGNSSIVLPPPTRVNKSATDTQKYMCIDGRTHRHTKNTT